MALWVQDKELCAARGCPGTGHSCETLKFGRLGPSRAAPVLAHLDRLQFAHTQPHSRKKWNLPAMATSLNVQHCSCPEEDLPLIS